MHDHVRIREVVLEQQGRACRQVRVQHGVAVGEMERHHREPDVVGPKLQVGQDRDVVGDQVAVAQHHALGATGGARGVEQHGQVVSGHARRLERLIGACAQFRQECRCRFRSVATRHRQHREVGRQRRAQCLPLGMVGIAHDQSRAAVRHLQCQHAGAFLHVQRHRGESCGQRAVEERHVLGAIAEQQAHAVAGLQAGRAQASPPQPRRRA